MTDGNTALPVSPVNKEEAMNLSAMFRKAAQAIVEASEMPSQIDALQSRVNDLEQQLQNKSVHAEELDRTLHEVRQQRDDARESLRQSQSALSQSQMDYSAANQRWLEGKDQIGRLEQALDTTHKERDEYGMQVLSLEEQVAAWKAKAEKARIRLNDVLSVFKQEEPEPVPQPEQSPQPETASSPSPAPEQAAPTPSPEAPAAMQPEPEQAPHPIQATSDPAPEVAGHPPQTDDPNLPEPQVLSGWEPGAVWDEHRNSYVRMAS